MPLLLSTLYGTGHRGGSPDRSLVIVIVVDASALVTALADDGPDGDRVRDHLRAEALAAPELVDLEVLSVVRRLVASGSLPLRRADRALQDLLDRPMQRARHAPLLDR